MNNIHYDIIWTNQFKKDYKLAIKFKQLNSKAKRFEA